MGIPCKEWSVVDNSLLESSSEVPGTTEDALPGEVSSNQSTKWSKVEVDSAVETIQSSSQCFGTKTNMIKDKEMLFELENLGVTIDPKCGGCKCSAFPINSWFKIQLF